MANTAAGRTSFLDERRALLLRMFGDWNPAMQHLIERSPSEAILRNDIRDFAPIKRWSRGSHHAACRCGPRHDSEYQAKSRIGIESAYGLAKSLEGATDLPAALLDYRDRRHERTAFITNQSWQVGRVAQWEGPWACALRNFVGKSLSQGQVKARLEKVVGGGPARGRPSFRRRSGLRDSFALGGGLFFLLRSLLLGGELRFVGRCFLLFTLGHDFLPGRRPGPLAFEPPWSRRVFVSVRGFLGSAFPGPPESVRHGAVTASARTVLGNSPGAFLNRGGGGVAIGPDSR